ncbi:MAG: alpha/beta hydrolase [Fidelibacterota bacterium]
MTAAANKALVLKTFQHQPETEIAIVGLHGWTGDESALMPLVHSINLKSAKWFFPRAPYQADNGTGYTWFSGTDETGWHYKKTWEGLDLLLESIRQEGFFRERIFLLGFSQGATLCMEYGVRLNFPLGGLIPIAGFIKKEEKLNREATMESTKTPVLLLHGQEDKIVTPEGSKKAYEFFLKRGHPVWLELYRAGHKIPLKAAVIIRDFINK